uniref:Short-chain dehydrogenase reductase 3b-like n=1 Tax=Nelumbo nucifera TaxID=4432 RepID=A0A822YA37_NELNU|nr:TPA_asm: hypothetical protein HUJ06_029453 [Nelumbo nucifera]
MYMEEFDNTMFMNVRGVASMIKHASRAMVERKICGSIVCTETVAAALSGSAPRSYTTSKHALVGLVRSACSELGLMASGSTTSPLSESLPHWPTT